ncbi:MULTISPECIES: DUF4143 domain-containing protein [unclassified Adlercreutzia]|uniref:DUF4143 domain-containing protein n=1 Tax=unclassified Adlercreutzia TaxID=2636013 RepID=UPI0019807374|nr:MULTISPECIES: DUF4143 domain-containing protein [unclassified Adlercreutzia]
MATGSLTNASKIQATFKSVLKSDISLNTVKSYIGYLEDSFLVSAASRYDVKGRKYIGAPLKYYFEDVGLRNARVGFRQDEENHLMENVVYNELRYRGFSVDVGVVRDREYDEGGVRRSVTREVDFVANLAGRRYYVQSAFAIPDVAKADQEKASLLGEAELASLRRRDQVMGSSAHGDFAVDLTGCEFARRSCPRGVMLDAFMNGQLQVLFAGAVRKGTLWDALWSARLPRTAGWRSCWAGASRRLRL